MRDNNINGYSIKVAFNPLQGAPLVASSDGMEIVLSPSINPGINAPIDIEYLLLDIEQEHLNLKNREG